MNHQTSIRSSYCFVLAGIFLASTAAGYLAAVSIDANSVASGRVIDTPEDPDLAGTAAKPVPLSVNDPRTTRLVYFRPMDRPFRTEVVDSMKNAILQIQGFFEAEMQRHGHGRRTFRFETDPQGEPLIHAVVGNHPDAHYIRSGGPRREVWNTLGRSSIELIVLDLSTKSIRYLGRNPAGATTQKSTEGDRSFSSTLISSPFSWRTMAHELGHAFDLQNDLRDESYIMSYGAGNQARLSACAAALLAVHPHFTDDLLIAREMSSATIDLISNSRYPPGSLSIPVLVRIQRSSGLHLVLFTVTTKLPHFDAGRAEVKACRSFSGERTAVVELDYDGLIPSNDFTSLADPIVHQMHVWAFETSGRFYTLRYSLYQSSDRHIDTLDESGVVRSLAFSPSSTALAAAGRSLVKYWDLQTGQTIAGFELASPARAVAISPDGATLAAEHNGTVRLWDLASQAEHAELAGQPGDPRYRSVAFSPTDGRTLAALSGDNTVKLWNLETKADYADLDHDSHITTFAFSPDGARLASGLNDGTVHIWDPATGKHVAAWKCHPGWIGAVAFLPPDSTTLATKAGWDGLVKLWDVRTQRHLATFRNARGGSSMGFSPDGVLLACAAAEVVKVWHVPTKTQIDSLAHRTWVNVVAFSPDGKTLATGTRRRLELWDAYEWVRPRPYAMAIVSGDGQRDTPETRLAGPFVVEVKDQNGHVLEGARVTFTVTRGNGTLTAATSATDSLGRATTVLYLGVAPGINTVEAAVPGLGPVLFFAIAIDPPDFDGDGEVGFGDFVLFARAFGGSDPGFDLNDSGTVDFADFLLFARYFGRSTSDA